MFENLDELEKEIESLHNNILASNNLLDSLNKLKESIVNENENVKVVNKSVQKTEDAIKDATDEINTGVSDSINNALNKQFNELKNTESNIENILVKTTEKIDQQNSEALKNHLDEFVKITSEVNSKLENANLNLESKYKDFVDEVEKVNPTLLHEKMNQIEKNVNLKITIAIVISAITAIISIVGIIM